MSPILRSKLDPDALPDFAVARPHLVARLDECWDRRLALVAAPAGYGKSVLLGQWRTATQGGSVAWLSIDERDRDAARLGEHLIGALAAVDPVLGGRAASLLGTPGPGLGDEVVDLLLDDLNGFDRALAVVLEDLDHIEGTSIIDDLSRLVMEAPPHLHFVVASRSDPTMPMHRLRASGQLLEVRAADLTFSPTEAAELVAALSDHQLHEDAAARLVQITEGWPVAVQLAGLSLRGAADSDALARFGAADGGIVDYLSAEVLAWLRPELRSFLLDVSVLHELRPGLCDAVTGEHHSAQLLTELRQGGVFVVPLGGDAGAYRLHRLVRELLCHDLARADPRRPNELRRRAAAWCLEQGDIGQAAEYLLAARAWDPLVELIHEHGRTLWDAGQAETVLGWLEAVPASIRRANVRHRLLEAALHVICGRAESGAALLAELERDCRLTPGEQVVADVVALGLVEVTLPRSDSIARQERTKPRLGTFGPGEVPDILDVTDPVNLECMFLYAGAKGRLLLGVPGALDDATAATSLPPSAAPFLQVHALGTVAWLEALANRSSAITAGARALDLARSHLGEEHPAVLAAHAGMAIAARNRDDLEEAAERSESALARALRWHRWPMVGFLLAERALVDLVRGRPREALTWLDRRTELGGIPLAPLVEDRFLAIERWAAAILGDAERRRDLGRPAVSWELSLTEVALAIDGSDPTSARKVLDSWPAACSPLGDLERAMATAMVEAAEGATSTARARCRDLLDATARDGLVAPFVAGGRPAAALVAEAVGERPNGHADAVLLAIRRAAEPGSDLVDPLSDREVEVLRLLPTRMSNAEIGRRLFVSTNTVKTHLKHIYQKLDATDRDQAVRRAQELRLL